MASPNSLSQIQTNLTLAYILNNAAKDSSWNDVKNPSPSQIRDNILSRSTASKMTAGRFAIAWGPAVVVGDDGYAANITAVMLGESGRDFRIVTSGTNFDSNLDFLEDNLIFPMVPLQNRIPACPASAKIAAGTDLGLQKIIETPSSTGSNTKLTDFLAKLPKNSTIGVIGHSLGGALASTLVLYLKSKLPDMNFYCQTFAGPTAGNGAFAYYFNEVMVGNALRVYNTLDIVPFGWSATSLDLAFSIYPAPNGITEDFAKKIKYSIDSVEQNNLDYTQWGLGNPTMQNRLSGLINSDIQGFELQMGYQHIYEYITLLGLQFSDIKMPPPVNAQAAAILAT